MILNPNTKLLEMNSSDSKDPSRASERKLEVVKVIDPNKRFSFDCSVNVAAEDAGGKKLCELKIEEESGESFEEIAKKVGFEIKARDTGLQIVIDGRAPSLATVFKKGDIKAWYGFGNYGCFNKSGYAGLSDWAQALITNGKKTYSLFSDQNEIDCDEKRSPMSEEELQTVIESFRFYP